MDAEPRIGGAFRDGDLLVLRLSDHRLPDQCLITGEPVQGSTALTFSRWAPRVSFEIEGDGSHINLRRFGPLTIRTVYCNSQYLQAINASITTAVFYWLWLG